MANSQSFIPLFLLGLHKKVWKFLKWQQKNMEMKLKNEHIATNISSEIIYKWKYGELYIFFQL